MSEPPPHLRLAAPRRLTGLGNFLATVLTGHTTKYYYFGSERVAMNKGGTLSFFAADHLGSTHVVANGSGGLVSRQTYYPFGAPRPTEGDPLPTDYTFTGQKVDASVGLMYYGARYYDAALGRFIQPDTIVPNPGDPQSLNRYSYVRNNPLKYTDPTGHMEADPGGGGLQPCYFPGNCLRVVWAPATPDKQVVKGTAGATWSTPGSPAWIYQYYGADYEKRDPALAAWFSDHPEYDPTLDPEVALNPVIDVDYRLWVLRNGKIDPASITEIWQFVAFAAGFTGGVVDANKPVRTWPGTAAEMDAYLGFEGARIPDTPTTMGRGKVIWRPSENVEIIFEQHPYHPTAPSFHTGPHWHITTPGGSHIRYLPGDLIPGF